MERYGLDIKRDAIGAEPATIEGVKALCGIDFADDDATITALCIQARKEAERFCGRVFIDTDVTVYAEYWVGSYELPYGPVSGNLLTVKDADDNDLTDYKLKGVGFKKLDISAPDGVYLTYRSAGYPDDAKTAIEMLTACLYDASFVPMFKADAYAILTNYQRAI